MLMGLLGILLALALLIGMAYRGWSVLLLAPAAALVAAGVAGEPVLAHWTQTFMPAAAGFLAQFFPIFLLGALFGGALGCEVGTAVGSHVDQNLLDAYRKLDCFPEVPSVLSALRESGAKIAILSNGTPAMLDRKSVV